MSRCYRSSKDQWTPRRTLSEAERQHQHGKLVPMDYEPGFFARLFGRR